jgi:hypothetical protein
MVEINVIFVQMLYPKTGFIWMQLLFLISLLN